MNKIYIFIAVLTLSAYNAQAWTFTWNGSASTAWANASNWTRSGTNTGGNTIPGTADNVVINNGALSDYPILAGNVSILNLTMSAGSLNLNSYTMQVLANAAFSGGTVSDGAVDARDFTDLRNTTFDAAGNSFQLSKVASSGNSDNNVFGGNTFKGPFAIVNQSDNRLRLASSVADSYQDAVVFEENGTGELEPAYNGVNRFSGDISTQGSNDPVSFGLGNGTVLVNAFTSMYGTQTYFERLTVNSTQSLNVLESFSVGTLRLWNGTISLNTNTLTVDDNAYIRGGTMEGGDFRFDDLDTMQGATFTDINIIKQGGGTNTVRGGNTFTGEVTIRNNDNSDFRMANVLGDDYNGDVTFLEMGSGELEPARNGNNTFAGNISTDGSNDDVTFGTGTGFVTIDGNTTQFIYGNASQAPTFERLRMSTSGSITLGVDTYIGEELIFNNGILIAFPSGVLIIQDNVVVSGTSNSSHVNGIVRKVGNDAFVFPTGNGSIYAPIGITAPNNQNTAFEAQYLFTPYSDLSVGSGLDHVSSQEYWVLDRTNGSSNVAVTLFHNAALRSGPVNNLSDLRVARYNGSAWVSEGNASTAGSTSAGTVTSNTVTNFSPFTLGSSTTLNPLPITLLNFNAVPTGVNVLVKWTTINEINNDFFTVEKSLDGKTWFVLGNVKGAGNTTVTSDYMLMDFAPVEGIQYYRLRQTDLDGKESLSGIVPVRFSSDANTTIVLFPQPAGNVLNVSIQNNENDNASITVYSTMGQKMIEMNSLSGTSFQIDLSNLSSGIYYLEFNLDGVITKSKVIKQ